MIVVSTENNHFVGIVWVTAGQYPEDIATPGRIRRMEGHFQPGIREVAWNPSSAGSPIMPGVYVAVLRAGSRQVQQRIAIAR